jgi:hypothetical protein
LQSARMAFRGPRLSTFASSRLPRAHQLHWCIATVPRPPALPSRAVWRHCRLRSGSQSYLARPHREQGLGGTIQLHQARSATAVIWQPRPAPSGTRTASSRRRAPQDSSLWDHSLNRLTRFGASRRTNGHPAAASVVHDPAAPHCPGSPIRLPPHAPLHSDHSVLCSVHPGECTRARPPFRSSMDEGRSGWRVVFLFPCELTL